MKIEKCSNCDFNIREKEMFCPDCGSKTLHFERNPLDILDRDFLRQSLTVSFYVYLLFFILMGILAFVGGIVANRPIERFIPIFIKVLPFWFLISTIVSFLLGIKLFNTPKKKELLGLRLRSETIDKRLADIDARQIEIADILQDIKTDETTNLQDVQTKLLSAKNTLEMQRIKYKLQQDKIEIVRLQNDVSPFLFEFQNLNNEQLETGLSVIETTKNEVKALRQKVISESIEDLPETKKVIDQLADTEDSYNKLREAIIRKQANNAVDDVSPIEDYLQSENVDEVTHAIETFNTNVELSVSIESFNELENEYLSLNSKYQLPE